MNDNISHIELHRAVRELLDGVNNRYPNKNPREWTCPNMQTLDDITQSAPQHALTDEERNAIERLCDATEDMIIDDKRADGCHWQDDKKAVAVVRGLLERTK